MSDDNYNNGYHSNLSSSHFERGSWAWKGAIDREAHQQAQGIYVTPGSGSSSGGGCAVVILAGAVIAAAVYFGHDDKKQPSNNAGQPYYSQPTGSAGASVQQQDTSQKDGTAEDSGQSPADKADAPENPPKYVHLPTRAPAVDIEIAHLTEDANFYRFELPEGALPMNAYNVKITQEPVVFARGSVVEKLFCDEEFCEVGVKIGNEGAFGLIAVAKLEVTGKGQLGEVTGIRLNRPSQKPSKEKDETAGLY